MDQDKFVATFRSHLQDISKYLTRRVELSQVEDLASEIFEIAWRKRESCPEGFELAWLYKIAGFVVSNHRKKISRRVVLLPLLDNDLSAPSAEDVALDGSGIAIAFGLLSPKDRQILSLLVFEQLSVKEISVVIGATENSTSQRLKRARERLAKHLGDQLSETQSGGH
ncbi:MAG: RNA polymerase sigma factor [Rhodoluna sp.]|nr:RNA polymerase sigma factor [Rhodoluna sp.]